MNFDLLEIFNSVVGAPPIRHASAYLGEPEATTRAAVRCAGPALLAGLMQKATTSNGPAEIYRCITDSRIDTAAAAKLASVFDNRGRLESLLGTGESLTGMLFGARTGSVTNALADASGVRPNSAMMLLSLAAPLFFGILKKHVVNNDLDASGLSSLLLQQQKSLARHGLEQRIAGALGFGSVPELLESLSAKVSAPDRAAPLQVRARQRAWMPWATAAAIALFGVVFFVNRTAEHQETPPGAVQIAEGQGESQRFKVATADSAQVYFDPQDARIDGEDRRRIADIAQSARGTDREVTVTSYASDAGGNRELANDRASAVREALVDEGVNENHIVVDEPREATSVGEQPGRVDIEMR